MYLHILYFVGITLRDTLLNTYFMWILLTKWQVLYPLGCLEPCMDLQNEKYVNENEW